MEVIEQLERWQERYGTWRSKQPTGSTENISDYPFVENARAPFTPARRSLPMLNLALISSAGAYIDGTEPFDMNAPDGDFTFRELPTEIDLNDLRFSARGYDATFVQQDGNVQVPLARLFEFESNRVIGQLNQVFWSFCGFIPDAARLARETLPRLVERLKRYEVQAALLIPAARLCHHSVALSPPPLASARLPSI